jgi:type II secretory pathway pseudopilin PulG
MDKLKMDLRLKNHKRYGFALIATLMLMLLLGLLAVGMLSLSVISFRSSSKDDAMRQARANARMALVIAIGELQKEMGPDMRVSAKAAILDQDPQTEVIEGVDQPHWLASYESWGAWLNGSYQNPASGAVLNIRDTYNRGRKEMFRRWLLSLPEGMEADIDAPVDPNGWDDSNSVVLVGKGSLGVSGQDTRAYLNKVGETGRSAWWIGPENNKARIDMASQPRNLSAENWEHSQGDSAEIGIGALSGLEVLDSDATLGDKLVTQQSLRPAGVDATVARNHFFDLTASSRGVLASVRTGHLKKDLSLLFEKGKSALPDSYRFDTGDVREPSIRPMSSEIADKAVLPGRHFAPWTRMRHFYRMYRQDSDAEAQSFPGGTPRSKTENGVPALSWTGAVPWTECNQNTISSGWEGQDSYTRFPIVSHITYILSLRTLPGTSAGKRKLEYVASIVYALWNPYNVELRLPDEALFSYPYLSKVQPLQGWLYKADGSKTHSPILQFDDNKLELSSSSEDGGSGPDIVFKPGEFRIFSPRNFKGANDSILEPGFDPQSYGGQPDDISGEYTQVQNPKFEFRTTWETWNKFNLRQGNTPGSFVDEFAWTTSRNSNDGSSRRGLPFNHHVDWFDTSQYATPISLDGGDPFVFSDSELVPVGYIQLVLKGLHDHAYPTIGWEQDWRCRNWIQAPPFYLGKGLYISEDPRIANTQRIDCPYEFRFGPLLGVGKDVDAIIQHVGASALMGPELRVTAAPALELPTAPIGSLAGFAGMRVNPGWTDLSTLNPIWGRGLSPSTGSDTTGWSQYRAEMKANAYQSGITGPGIGNSFLHPMISRTEVYRFLENSTSMDMKNELDISAGYTSTKTNAYCDYWDHVLLLNDALWDDYFVSSLADQTRPGASVSSSLGENLEKLANGGELSNSRYIPHLDGRSANEVKAELEAADGYLKAAAHLMVEGMFNVNSTSVDAWNALFAGIRERKVVYRDANGALKPVAIPSGKRIALSRFNTETTDQEGNDPEFGVNRDDGQQAWSGVRFLDDAQLRKLAEECVKQVKQRGPFLNFSEFINRRLSDDDLGIMGALQSAIDYDDFDDPSDPGSPDPLSINYDFKSDSAYILREGDLGQHEFATPEAAVGSRFAGIPGYVIQSDLLKPIANTLAVRDDTFRIRAYGDSRDKSGNVIAREWCEAIVQRLPEYSDESNAPEVPARQISESGEFSDNPALSETNRRFGRKFQIVSFRWLSGAEI